MTFVPTPMWNCPWLDGDDHWSCSLTGWRDLRSCGRSVDRCECPFDMGPWGAWRAFVGVVAESIRLSVAIRTPPYGNTAQQIDAVEDAIDQHMAAQRAIGAVGWSS